MNTVVVPLAELEKEPRQWSREILALRCLKSALNAKENKRSSKYARPNLILLDNRDPIDVNLQAAPEILKCETDPIHMIFKKRREGRQLDDLLCFKITF